MRCRVKARGFHGWMYRDADALRARVTCCMHAHTHTYMKTHTHIHNNSHTYMHMYMYAYVTCTCTSRRWCKSCAAYACTHIYMHTQALEHELRTTREMGNLPNELSSSAEEMQAGATCTCTMHHAPCTMHHAHATCACASACICEHGQQRAHACNMHVCITRKHM